MLICPVQNEAKFNLNWIQVRPRVSQWFGLNPAIYAQFGLKGHNGIDLAVPVGTPLFAPMDGIIKIQDQGKGGYGKVVYIRNSYKACEVVIGHCSEFLVKDGQSVNCLQKIALSGNTGFSTGPHTHIGLRFLNPSLSEDIWLWSLMDYNNGFKGYCDFEMACFKGSLISNSL